MGIIYKNFIIGEETYLKGKILTQGVEFSKEALKIAIKNRAKGQNLVYNMPINSEKSRPQEIIIKNKHDSYSTVSSCVASTKKKKAVLIDTDINNNLVAIVDGKILQNIDIQFVQEPKYYQHILSNGEFAKKYVSACGLDELNIIPWRGCAISKPCKFCGINSFIEKNELSAFTLKKDCLQWDKNKRNYLKYLKEAIEIAKKDKCYKRHMHVILIAGNLSNEQLDLETRIFSEITREIFTTIKDKSTEGIVLVITPPNDLELLKLLKISGISKVVFNMEAISKEYQKKYCPGKAELGYNYFIERLERAVKIFGKGNTWTNLVFGLEPLNVTLNLCKEFAEKGIIVSANVLHLDQGNTLDCGIPDFDSVINFFYELEMINNKHEYLPYYCAEALRTSLTNEAHDGRIVKERKK